MQVISRNIEATLIEQVRAARHDIGSPHYAIHFHLSNLQEKFRSEFQLRIAVNILSDVFKDQEGMILVSGDGDLFVLYRGTDRNLVEKAVFQLRYLFVDDPLANYEDGKENPSFSDVYDLALQWHAFYRVCNERMSLNTQEQVIATSMSEDHSDIHLLTPSRLLDIMGKLRGVDLLYPLRKQPICVLKSGQSVDQLRPVFYETYIQMQHLQRLLDVECELTSEPGLFHYLTQIIDRRVLALIGEKPEHYLHTPISLNLNVRTILSEDFLQFAQAIAPHKQSSIVVEVHIADVFSDMRAFLTARDIVQEHGHRICLDGLIPRSFVQIDRERLGFDLAKVAWNADVADDLSERHNARLVEAVQQCGANRMILCRCDSHHAITYGHALGISLFQGRHPDHVVSPNTTLEN